MTYADLLRRAFIIAALLAAWAMAVRAGGERSNVRGLAMGMTGTAPSLGLEALGVNPANLATQQHEGVAIGLFPLGVQVGSDFLTYGLYSDYLTGIETDTGRVDRHLSEADKQTILNAFHGDRGNVVLDASVRPIGIAFGLGSAGAIAFSITERASAEIGIPRESLEFLFYGNTPGSIYTFEGSALAATWTREYALSYAIDLGEVGPAQSFRVGGTIKAVHGFGYAELIRSNTRLATSEYGALDGTMDVLARVSGADPFLGDGDGGSFSLFPQPAGSGAGVDLGVAAIFGEAWTVGVSVTDIGSISWKRGLKEYVSTGTLHLDDPLVKSQRDSVEAAVIGDERPGSAFSTSLPTALRTGVSVAIHKLPWGEEFLAGELLVALEYDQGFSSMPASFQSGRVGIGLEYAPIPVLPLRGGASFVGGRAAILAIGFGVRTGIVDVDLAAENVDWIFSPRALSTGSMALGITVRL
jgi:hypothetical protein